MADTGNNIKIVHFTYSYLYARPIKMVRVDNIIKKQSFLLSSVLRSNLSKLKFWKLLSNS